MSGRRRRREPTIMPLYEYSCRRCGEAFEVLQRMGERGDELRCPACGATGADRRLSTFAAGSGSGSGRAASAAAGRLPAAAPAASPEPTERGPVGPPAAGKESEMETSAAAFTVTSPLGFDAAVARCREALAAEGFGVLTEIDVKATLKKKLDADVPPYVILGACHPPSAHRALTALPEVGVLLPCNVTVSEEEGRTVVRAMNPHSALGILDSPVLAEVATEVGAALERVVQALEG